MAAGVLDQCPEILDLKLDPNPEADSASRALGPFERAIAHRFGIADRGRPGDRWLLDAARWAWRTKIETQVAVDLRLRIWTQAEDEAVKVFAANLRDLLLAAPAGGGSWRRCVGAGGHAVTDGRTTENRL